MSIGSTKKKIADRVHSVSTPGAVLTDIYTVPSNKKAKVSINVCNISNGNKSFRIAISPLGAAIDNSHYIYYGKIVSSNDSFEVGIKYELKATDIIRVYGSDANLQFTVNGKEY